MLGLKANHVSSLGPWTQSHSFNSLTPERFGCDFIDSIPNLILSISSLRSLHDNALRWMPQNLTDHKSTLVQVIAWCRQATSRYLNQWWLGLLSSYGVVRPQWVNSSKPRTLIYSQINRLIIDWCNGLSPFRCQAITWALYSNRAITFFIQKWLELSSVQWWPIRFGLNALKASVLRSRLYLPNASHLSLPCLRRNGCY